MKKIILIMLLVAGTLALNVLAARGLNRIRVEEQTNIFQDGVAQGFINGSKVSCIQ